MIWLRRAAQLLQGILYLAFMADCGLLLYNIGAGRASDTGGEIDGGGSLIVIVLLMAALRAARERWLDEPPNYL